MIRKGKVPNVADPTEVLNESEDQSEEKEEDAQDNH
jgi:hypothetical protein